MDAVFKSFRIKTWWNDKISEVLAVFYICGVTWDIALYNTYSGIGLVLGLLCVGTLYYSIVSTVSDAYEQQMFAPATGYKLEIWSYILPLLCLALGLGLVWLMKSRLAMGFALLSFLLVSLYVLPGFRLKNAGFLGIFVLAAGSGMLPSVAVSAFFTNRYVGRADWLWTAVLGLWALLWGIRYLWVRKPMSWRTLPEAARPVWRNQGFHLLGKWPGSVLLSLEIPALVFLLFRTGSRLPLTFLGIYLVIACCKHIILKKQVIAVRVPDRGSFLLFLYEFYQVYLPLSLLLVAVIRDTGDGYLLLLHCLLSFKKMVISLSDLVLIVKKTLKPAFRKGHGV